MVVPLLLLGAGVLLLVLIVWWRSSPFYWRRLGVPHLPARPLFGSCSPTALLGGQLSLLNSLYEHVDGQPYLGFHLFNKPALLVTDPTLVESMLVRDFEYFGSRGIYANPVRDYMALNLFTLDGNAWKYTRGKLSPFFTSVKIKRMLHFAGDSLRPLMAGLTSSKPVQVHSLMTKFTTDVLTKSTFGIESDAYKEDSKFVRVQNVLFGNILVVKIFLGLASRRIFDWLRCLLLNQETNDFMIGLTKELIEAKKKCPPTNQKDDFMTSMIELSEKEADDHMKNDTIPIKFDDKMIAAQMMVVFAGGTESGASTLSFSLYELAANPDIQEKARNEAISVLKGQLPDYDSLQEMKYINAVIAECLRKYPPFGMLNRMCTKPYRIPGTDVVLKEGTIIIISANNIQNDPKNYPFPDVFRPERFLGEEAAGRPQGSYMPFGLGPRICLGMKFALNEMALVLVHLLMNFEFTFPTGKSGKNCMRVPLRRYKFISQLENGIWLVARPLN